MREKKTAPTVGNNFEQITTISPNTGLTPQQEQACMLLASGESYTATAKRLGINRGTLYKWGETQAFKCHLNSICFEFQQGIKNNIIGLHDKAMRVINDVLVKGNDNARLKAAIWIIEKTESSNVETISLKELIRDLCTLRIGDFAHFDEDTYRQLLHDYGMSE